EFRRVLFRSHYHVVLPLASTRSFSYNLRLARIVGCVVRWVLAHFFFWAKGSASWQLASQVWIRGRLQNAYEKLPSKPQSITVLNLSMRKLQVLKAIPSYGCSLINRVV